MPTVDSLRHVPRDRPVEREDRSYWLNRCHGFSVHLRGDRIGVVEDVLYASRADVPDQILVRTGHLLHGLLELPVEQVERIDAESGSVELSG